MQTVILTTEPEIRQMIREEVERHVGAPTAIAPAPQAEWLSPVDVAKLLNLSRITIIRRCQEGQLPAKKVGNIWRIHRSAVAPE